jgi:hypothetical protein
MAVRPGFENVYVVYESHALENVLRTPIVVEIPSYPIHQVSVILIIDKGLRPLYDHLESSLDTLGPGKIVA